MKNTNFNSYNSLKQTTAHLVFVLLLLAACQMPEKVPTDEMQYFFVGTYTDNEFGTGKGKGIYAYQLNPQTGEMTYLNTTEGMINPSYLAIEPSRDLLFTVNQHGSTHEDTTGTVSVYKIDRATKTLSFMNKHSALGATPCHISFDANKKFLLVANYVGGNIAALPILEDGQLGAPTGMVQHIGSHTHPRQTAPHAHFIKALPNGDILAVDLGLDQVLKYTLTTKGELVSDTTVFYQTAKEAGPRHYISSSQGDIIYVLNELNSTVEVAKIEKGKAINLQTISTLPEGYEGEGNCAAIKIHPSGKFLYASNRKNHHSIVVYSINTDGTLTLVEHESTQGETPRDFEIDPTGQMLLVGNQATDNLLTFKIDATTGALTATGFKAEVPTAVCIKFL